MPDFIKLDIKKEHQIQSLLRLTIPDAAPERYQVRPVSLQTFQARSKTKTMISEIGFPTLTGDASLNQKTNKQTSHE